MLTLVRTKTLDALKQRITDLLVDGVRRAVEVDGLNQMCAAYREELAYAKAQNEKLTATVVELRREGFNPTQQQGAPKEDAGADLPPAVYSAIRDIAKPGTELYHELVEQAAREVAMEIATEQICKNLRRGSSFNPLHA